ncbi:MAG: hypothetical protein JSW30_03260 [Dehalococcoidia bacterium]|nr:MAG: hypothetical protein JSW30_03260 [Dehalococcoidia bacterium]
MKKREAGQALLLVLIVLAIGSLMIIPLLEQAFTVGRFRQITNEDTKEYYTAVGAQEYVFWKFLYDSFGENFVNDGDNVTLPCNVCDTPVTVFVVMKSSEYMGAVAFATQHVIRPTKTVSPDTVANDTINTHTYTIKLEQLSANTTQGLDAIYDILPKGFSEDDYVEGSSYIKEWTGDWESIGDPTKETVAGQARLLWPNTYVWDQGSDNGSGGFTAPFSDFQLRETKYLKFQVHGDLPKNTLHGNWIVLKPWDTLSGPVAPIMAGTPDPPNVMEGGLCTAYVTANPEIIQPGVETDIEFTVHITNIDVETLSIDRVYYWLPPDFTYTENSTSGITTSDPVQTLQQVTGQERWFLDWTGSELPGGSISVASAETVTLTFWSKASKDSSGVYFSEAFVVPDKPSPTIFRTIGVDEEEYTTNYTWNTGAVEVPSYDSQSNSGDTSIYSNIGIIPGGMNIMSWHIE